MGKLKFGIWTGDTIRGIVLTRFLTLCWYTWHLILKPEVSMFLGRKPLPAAAKVVLVVAPEFRLGKGLVEKIGRENILTKPVRVEAVEDNCLRWMDTRQRPR